VLWLVLMILAVTALTGALWAKLRRLQAENSNKSGNSFSAKACGADELRASSRPPEAQERVAAAASQPAPIPEAEAEQVPAPEPQARAPCTGDADFPRWVQEDRVYKERLSEWREHHAHKLRHPELVRLRNIEKRRMTRSQAVVQRIGEIEAQLGTFDDYSEVYFRRIMEALDSVRLNMARDKVLGDAKRQHAGEPVK
jgi:hypothetical protein